MNEKDIEISEELSNYIEGLQYESDARKDLCAYMLSQGMGDTDEFKTYHEEYISFYSQYLVAKNEITQMLNTMGYKSASWTLDFATHTVKVRNAY